MTMNRLLQKMSKLAKWQKLTSNRPCTIAVEGNIGSGKTTFLEHMKSLGNVTILSEPVELWRNCNGHNLLGLMYEDPKKWGFTFQSYVQLTMLKNHTVPVQTPLKIMERSIYSARYCFVNKMQTDGILSAPSAAVIDEWFQWVTQNRDLSVDLFVYLRTSPEVAYERVFQRNRSEEKTIPFEYIKSLHDIHEKWLYHKTLFKCPAPVFIIDGDLDLSVIQNEYDKFEEQILSKKLVSVG